MKLLSLAASLLIGLWCAAAPAAEVLKKNLVHSHEVPAITVAAWEVDGKVMTATGADIAKAPPDAARQDVRTFQFPTGYIREITFKEGVAGLHPITTETQLFVLRGAARVDVGRLVVSIKAGDAVSRPSGAIRKAASGEDTLIVAWDVAYTEKAPRPMVVYADQVTPDPVASWTENGKGMNARGAEAVKKVPANAGGARWVSRRYQFDGNSIRYNEGWRGDSNATSTPSTESLIYIHKGRFRRHEGPEVAVVSAGDVVREEVGLPGHWDVIEDPGFLSTTSYPRN